MDPNAPTTAKSGFPQGEATHRKTDLSQLKAADK